MLVLKSSGITEEYDESKLARVLNFSVENTSVSASQLLSRIKTQLHDGMSSKDIQRAVIKIAADSISVEEPDYQYVAARNAMYALRKDVYDQFDPIRFEQLIKRNTARGIYDPEILEKWTSEEIAMLEQHIDHDRDFKFAYAGVMQFKEKYLCKNRGTGEIYETPQYAYMLIAMCLHQDEQNDRIRHVLNFYNAVSNQKISLPTPIMSGVRTPTRQFSSCVLIESGDSLDSVNATSAAIIKYISKRAGIGVNGGGIRAEGSVVRAGEIRHTGVIPFWKHFQTAVKSCSQGGVRGGAATLTYPLWHLEVEKLLVLKNNKGVEENRIRHLDYSVSISRLMMQRLASNEYISLFSPDECGGKLYAAYYDDPAEFERLYLELESDPSIRKKRIKATELFSMFCQERAGTGRVYPIFCDNMNAQTPYIEPIRQSNLCLEIALPTTPMGEPMEEIALCTLAAYNMGEIDSPDEFRTLAPIVVRALDNLLDYQDYAVSAAEKAKLRRSLGIGITNFAYFLAKNFVGYDESAKYIVHEWMEAMSFYNIQASCFLAKERGTNAWHHKTRWSQGKLPIDWYNTNVDKLITPRYKMNWEALRADVEQYGMRNDTTSAFMPCESSSQISNSTNGIEPPRALVSVKASKDGVFNQVVPEVDLLKDEYGLYWDVVKKDNYGYLTLVAIMQKFVDQAISANAGYDPETFPDGKIPMERLFEELAFCSHYGIKTLYYSNMRDGADGTEDDESCEGCKV
ncbi:ribonucleotide reductase large subunit [Vibrio phage 1.081.O._10N.286.52.C2]|nr:ribonucleotide reductase large subunit [Vibrio phage 1.081.O._10N.286.52.C2]